MLDLEGLRELIEERCDRLRQATGRAGPVLFFDANLMHCSAAQTLISQTGPQ